MFSSCERLNSPTHLSWSKLHLSRAKLKVSSKTSAILSGFAMIAMAEVKLGGDTDKAEVKLDCNTDIVVAYVVCTTLLVSVNMLGLMISTIILPNFDAICNLHSITLVQKIPHERLHWYIETTWAFSTFLGFLLFLCEFALLCYITLNKHSRTAAWSACIIVIPVFIIIITFMIHFHRSLATHKYKVIDSRIRELELLKKQIEKGNKQCRSNGMALVNRNAQIV